MRKTGEIYRYKVGVDFTEEEIKKWKEQLIWWVSKEMPRIPNPPDYVDSVLIAALNGTKLNGDPWLGISNSFYKRIKQFVGFDLEKGVGFRGPKSNTSDRKVTLVGPNAHSKTTSIDSDLPEEEIRDMQNEYITELVKTYPHLSNAVYGPKVEELAETVIKSRLLSTEFMTAKGATLERLSKIRESLHKQQGELMSFLEISPAQLLKKTTSKDVNLGNLISRLDSYGEAWQEYERLDALRELIQKYRMLNQKRPDGTPQLNAWELWHQTRNRPVKFTCRCGETFTLLGGFTPEEIEQALLQAQEVYGFGIEPLHDKEEESWSKEVDPELDPRFDTSAPLVDDDKDEVEIGS
jgi:hypothetical protein